MRKSKKILRCFTGAAGGGNLISSRDLSFKGVKPRKERGETKKHATIPARKKGLLSIENKTEGNRQNPGGSPSDKTEREVGHVKSRLPVGKIDTCWELRQKKSERKT